METTIGGTFSLLATSFIFKSPPVTRTLWTGEFFKENLSSDIFWPACNSLLSWTSRCTVEFNLASSLRMSSLLAIRACTWGQACYYSSLASLFWFWPNSRMWNCTFFSLWSNCSFKAENCSDWTSLKCYLHFAPWRQVQPVSSGKRLAPLQGGRGRAQTARWPHLDLWVVITIMIWVLYNAIHIRFGIYY